MSNIKAVINRREAMMSVAFTIAGATVFGPSMYRVLEDTTIHVRLEHAQSVPGGNPEGLTKESLESGLREQYQQREGHITKRVSAFLGAAIGFVSHDKSRVKKIEERTPDIY